MTKTVAFKTLDMFTVHREESCLLRCMETYWFLNQYFLRFKTNFLSKNLLDTSIQVGEVSLFMWVAHTVQTPIAYALGID